MPDPRLMLVLYEQKLEKRKRKVPKKSKSEQLWLGKRSEDEPPGEWGKFEEV
ncbi:hypothetical protein [Endozoicomonas sp. ONNA2]|uniref:hypothetical protein n=1 Tax=Endozoicomonas sp. ONNA2 TaxID=2828741 RepID=UPI002149184A|nr:hypothetical protein [Endozoicomonas sp. ONNA2]